MRRDIGGGRCHIVQADLAVADEVDGLWSEALAIAPGLNVLINNAGIFVETPVAAPLEQWRAAWSRVMQVNLLAPADLCRAAINHFRGIGCLVRAKARIWLKNLAYHMRRLLQLERHAMAGVP